MGYLLSVDQVAERLGIARPTVFRLISRGEIPSVMVTPRARRVAETDLLAFIDARRTVR